MLEVGNKPLFAPGSYKDVILPKNGYSGCFQR